MEPQVSLDAKFMAEQERRRAKDLEPKLYDVTAWSLPLMFNVTTDRCADDASGALAAFAAGHAASRRRFATRRELRLPRAVGIDGRRALARPAALREGIPVSSSDFAFTHEGRAYPAGTLIFRKFHHGGTRRQDRSASPRNQARTSQALTTAGSPMDPASAAAGW